MHYIVGSNAFLKFGEVLILFEQHFVLHHFNRNHTSIVNYFVSSYFDKKKDSNKTVLFFRIL